MLASYVGKYMSSHISEKDVHEKVLATNPILHNVKETQKLDECMKKLLSGNKKLNLKLGKNIERYQRESSINFRSLDQTL